MLNLKEGLVKGVSVPEVKQMLADKADFIMLDVRSAKEAKLRPLKGGVVVNIPITELRARYGEIPPHRKIIAFCPLGIRSYEAATLLQGKGYQNVSFMKGGTSALPELTDAD
nr:rhodanese-like domain-containing protein [Dehalobacterium formicoaceticum]